MLKHKHEVSNVILGGFFVVFLLLDYMQLGSNPYLYIKPLFTNSKCPLLFHKASSRITLDFHIY